MITKLNVASIYVLDKDEALDFYVNKLGLEKGNDVRQGDYRWLTVRVPGRRRHRDLPGAAGPAAARRSDRSAAPRADHQGRAERPRLHHRRRPRPVRDAQGARRHRLHPGAHRPLLRHRHGHPGPVRQPHPDPPAGQPRRRRDSLTVGPLIASSRRCTGPPYGQRRADRGWRRARTLGPASGVRRAAHPSELVCGYRQATTCNAAQRCCPPRRPEQKCLGARLGTGLT